MPVTRYEPAGFAVIGLSEIERLFRSRLESKRHIESKPSQE
jgi:hypothetical protein